MEEVRLVPQLRFPEFEGEWKYLELKKFIFSSAFGPRFSSNLYNKKGNIATLRTTDLNDDGEIDYQNMPSAQLNFEDFEDHILEKGDLVISRSGTIGVTGVFDGYSKPVLPGAFLIRFRFDISRLNPYFLKFYFNSKKGRTKLQSLSAGGVQKNLTGTSVLSIKQCLPYINEQQKIASFLTAVDKRINLLTLKKKKLEEYKKGVMQKLFSRELRFKDEDGNEFPEWEEKRLGEIGQTYNGITGKSKEDFGIGKPYIQYMQIFSNSRINVNQFGFVRINGDENQNKAQKGDIFFTTSSETPDEIGMTSVLCEDVEEVYLNSFCFGFRPNSIDEIVSEFSQYLFRSNTVRSKIIQLAQGSTRYNMSKVELMKLSISLPCAVEQQKIATFLSSIDKQIETESKQIDAMKEWKKGLLQKMFV